jgi:hypothetical protein
MLGDYLPDPLDEWRNISLSLIGAKCWVSTAPDEKTLGSESASTANDIMNLAALFMLEMKYSEAEELFQQSLAITEKLQDQPSVVATVLA